MKFVVNVVRAFIKDCFFFFFGDQGIHRSDVIYSMKL